MSDKETKPEPAHLNSLPKLTIVLDRRDIERCYSNSTSIDAVSKSLGEIPFDSCSNFKETSTLNSKSSNTKETKRNDDNETKNRVNLKSLIKRKRKRNRPKVSPDKRKKPGPTAKNLTAAERKLRYNYGVCPICGKYSKGLQTHLKTHQDGDELVECDYCHRKLVGKRNLRSHFNCHFKERLVWYF